MTMLQVTDRTTPAVAAPLSTSAPPSSMPTPSIRPASPCPLPAAPRGARTLTSDSSVRGGQLAQHVLQADPRTVEASLVERVRGVDPPAVPAVARAAMVTGISDKAFLGALAEAAVRAMPELAPGDICSVAEDFSELGCYNIAFKDALADHVLAKLKDFDGDMLGKTLRAFGSMQYYDDELLEGVVSYVQQHPHKFSSENIADVVYAFSKCGFCHPDLVSVVETAAGKLLAEPAVEGGKAIADILDAYSRVGCSSPESVDDLVARIPASIPSFQPDCLAKVTVAIIRLGYDDKQLLDPMLGAVQGFLVDLQPKHIVKLVRVLGELGYVHRPLLDEVTDRVIPSRLDEFELAGLDDVVNSLNKLGYYNSQFMTLMKQAEEKQL